MYIKQYLQPMSRFVWHFLYNLLDHYDIMIQSSVFTYTDSKNLMEGSTSPSTEPLWDS